MLLNPAPPSIKLYGKIKRAFAARSRFDLLPRIGAGGLHERAQSTLFVILARHQRIVVQRIEQFAPHLDAILETIQRRLRSIARWH